MPSAEAGWPRFAGTLSGHSRRLPRARSSPTIVLVHGANRLRLELPISSLAISATAAFFGLRNASEHDSDAGRESGPLVTSVWPRIGLRDGTVPVRAIAEVALSARNQGLPGRTRRSTHRNDNPPAANAEPHREGART